MQTIIHTPQGTDHARFAVANRLAILADQLGVTRRAALEHLGRFTSKPELTRAILCTMYFQERLEGYHSRDIALGVRWCGMSHPPSQRLAPVARGIRSAYHHPQ